MEQLTQQLKSGFMEILEVPFPTMDKNQVLVRNLFSVISAGTEGKTVTDARKGYIAKAKSRQKELKMVIDMIKTEGLKKTYNLVMNKLEAPSSLGYSCCGEITAVGENIHDLKVGDLVACGGGGAVHAEIVSINRNLCTKIPETVDPAHAAFATIAAIAIQGIRQADLRFGENCTVIGLGLIGLLTVQILKASGIKAIGVDINPSQVKKALEIGAHRAWNRNQEGIEQAIIDFTDGNGTDAVIITAASSSTDPVEFAGMISRKKGRVVIVGAVPTGFSRQHYYKKELDLRMSSSYGPGRYDPVYEEKGIDYPIGYVRFTENRNMQTFISYLEEKKIDMQGLITHKFDLQDASQAYDLILEKKEPYIGVLIKYEKKAQYRNRIEIKKNGTRKTSINIGLIGAGNFAQNAILPRIAKGCNFTGVVTRSPNTSRYVADKYAFKYCSDQVEDLLQDEETGTVVIATRHNSHALHTISCLNANKNVFVEKPLGMDEEELVQVQASYEKSQGQLMVGFNRRFSPHIEKVKTTFSKEQKKVINIRINAGIVPHDHWVQDPEIGGGRIIGEACHFIDLACFLADGKVIRVHSIGLPAGNHPQDTILINLEFDNESIASIQYLSNGNKKVPKEWVEVFCNESVIQIDNFITTSFFGKNSWKFKTKGQDKGHTKQFSLFLDALKGEKEFPVSFEDSYHSSWVTLQVIKSLRENRIVTINE